MKYIDVTPTWEGILNVLLHLYENGDEKGRATAAEELRRMAQIADMQVAQSKGGAELVQSDPETPIT